MIDTIPSILFYMFAAVHLCCRALMVVLSRNPVHSVLASLILAFFNAAGCSCFGARNSSPSFW